MLSSTSIISVRNFFSRSIAGKERIGFYLSVLAVAYICLMGLCFSTFHLSGFAVHDALLHSHKVMFFPDAFFSDDSKPHHWLALVCVSVHFIAFAMLVGIFASVLAKQKGSSVKRRKKVAVKGKYFIVLGWTDQVYTILFELIQAYSSEKPLTISLLADQPVGNMENSIKERMKIPAKVKLIFQQGKPQELFDLQLMEPALATSILLLPENDQSAEIANIQTIMALGNPVFHQFDVSPNIIAELNDGAHIKLARIIGGKSAILIYTKDIMVRILAQTSRNKGLHTVYEELLAFDGAEIYFKKFPQLTGMKFGDIWPHFSKATLIGLRKNNLRWSQQDHEAFNRHHDRQIVLLPPPDYEIQEDDKLIFIGEDFKSIAFHPQDFALQENLMLSEQIMLVQPETTLVLGWNRFAHRLLKELDNYLPANSTIKILVTELPAEEELKQAQEELLKSSVQFEEMDFSRREVLTEIRFQEVDQVIILSDTDHFSKEEADIKTLMVLTHVRDLIQVKGASCNLVAEMNQQKMKDLATQNKPNDFILSKELISRMMVQLAINPELKEVYEELFDAYGSEIQLPLATEYLPPLQKVTYMEVCHRVYQRNRMLLGYRIAADVNDLDRNFGIVINPPKSSVTIFQDQDQLIVLTLR